MLTTLPFRTVLILLLLAACYHATVETGLTPSTVVLEKSFASSWIYGLVAPSTVETASRCGTGVAKVETQLSFLNQLVGLLTFGIYTPMRIKVTCASAGAGLEAGTRPVLAVPAAADSTIVRGIFSEAAEQAAALRVAVLVQFER